MRVSIPFRYFAHGRAKGARRPDLHCVGETDEIEVPHLSASDRMAIMSPNLFGVDASLPVALGSVWHPVHNCEGTPVTSTAQALQASLALAEGRKIPMPIRPTNVPSGTPTTPENQVRPRLNDLLLHPGMALDDRIVDVTASNREIRRRQALHDAQDLAVIDGVLCTSRYEPLFRVFGIDQDPASDALHCEMVWHDRRTGTKGRYLVDLNERSVQGHDLTSSFHGPAHDLPGLFSMPDTLTSSGHRRAGPHYDLRIVDMPQEDLVPSFDPLSDIDDIVLNLTRARLAGLFHSSRLAMAPKAAVEMALGLVSDVVPSPAEPPGRLVDAQWWIEQPGPPVDAERLAENLSTIIEAFRGQKALAPAADAIEAILRDRNVIVDVISTSREETPSLEPAPTPTRTVAPSP